MTIGSAASRTLSQVPFPALPASLRARLALVPQTLGQGIPLRHRPALAADDPPRAPILVVEPERDRAGDLERDLRDLGYGVVGPALSAREAHRAIDRAMAMKRSISCALIDVDMPGAAEVADRLAGQNIPWLWLVPGAGAILLPRAAPVIAIPYRRADLSTAIARRLAEDARDSGTGFGRSSAYPKPPPQEVWPRVFPQL
jgi:hypothetical protein